ncbi:hypothetical protein BGZ57DRAFT_885390 [Hyaloscypha finlandica]|nr:hypothetical protein BGZ57DRAFT_885390 [Hyaloscypha finlandica]
MSFPQFTSFPPEILSLILGSCPPNDLTCLRLTCKAMYNLSPSKEVVSLENTDIGPLCGKDNSIPRWPHRHECHKASYEAICKRNAKLGRSTPEMKRKCRTGWSSNHCECYSRQMRLHRRIKSWMPSSLHYCGECEMFTKRKKQHNGRCYHGLPKQRRYEGHYWTHTSRGGAFGRKIWKKWFNNRAMNRLEARLRQDRENQRKGSNRYSLRKLEPKPVNTKVVRGQPSYF